MEEENKKVKPEKKKKNLKVTVGVLILMIVLLCLACEISIIIYRKTTGNETATLKSVIIGKVDDWEYDPEEVTEDSAITWSTSSSDGMSLSAFDSSSTISTTKTDSDSTLGYSTGGAMDVNSFRENIAEGYLPISTDITYTGLFYDYTFDTGNSGEESDELFYPSYSAAVSNDPISDEEEYYLTVGLNSNIKESDFERKKLNLVIVLDNSGSMDSSFSSYYYDMNDDEDSGKSKMEIANESVNILIDQLNDDDRFGMVIFNSKSYLAKPLNLIEDTDMSAIKEHILDIEATGGTNLEAGYQDATELFEEYLDVDSDEYENRIIVITDAMPNIGAGSSEMLRYIEENADDGIYTTFIGVGVDFNTEFTEAVSDVKGANYYSVNSSSEFKERMGEQFEYMVTPLVFDLELDLESDDYEIEAVYGSDTANPLTGNIMSVNTLFPSVTTSDGEVKGGVVLLKLNKLTDETEGNLHLTVSYKDRNGESYENSQNITFSENEEEYYDNTGIEKAIVLTRYANVLKDWILYERSNLEEYLIDIDTGIMYYDYDTEEIYKILGEYERTSTNLVVSDEYKEIFEIIKDYIEDEIDEVDDDTLEQEVKLLEVLIDWD